MADIIKRRKRLAPIRMEMSRELGDDIVTTLCKYMDVSKKSVFRYATPLDLSFLFQLQDVLRQRTELFYPKRISTALGAVCARRKRAGTDSPEGQAAGLSL